MKRYTCQNTEFPAELVSVPAETRDAAEAFASTLYPEHSKFRVIKERTPIAMCDFFALERVKDLQRTQSQNPYGSKMHRWASEEMRRMADQYCDDKGVSCETYFGEY